MILHYEIVFKRKYWITIGSAEIEVKVNSFAEGDIVMNQLMTEQYSITGSTETYAEFINVPSLSLDGIHML